MGINILTIKDIRNYLSKELKGIYPESEISTLSSIIIKTVTGIKRLHQPDEADKQVSAEAVTEVIKICCELKTGKPIQYILGETLFHDCIIKVNNETLIPRNETEELVDLIIRENKGYKGKIIDIGTGSGCIAIALSKNLPEAEITGIDISEGALKLAGENASLNNVNVTLIKNDIFHFSPKKTLSAGIIVSNPPYVRDSERQFMNRNVLDFEPHEALFVSDSDPLKYYRAILNVSESILLPDGKIYFEINEAMGLAMKELLESYKYVGIRIIKDINGKNRIIKGIRNV